MSNEKTFMHELADELNSMEHHVDAIEAEVRGQHPELADELREKLRTAQDHAEVLKSAEPDSHDVATKARSAWDDLKAVLAKARSRLGD